MIYQKLKLIGMMLIKFILKRWYILDLYKLFCYTLKYICLVFKLCIISVMLMC